MGAKRWLWTLLLLLLLLLKGRHDACRQLGGESCYSMQQAGGR